MQKFRFLERINWFKFPPFRCVSMHQQSENLNISNLHKNAIYL